MSMRRDTRFETEATPEGEQSLIPGVRPVTLKQRLEPAWPRP